MTDPTSIEIAQITFVVDGEEVSVPDNGVSLLAALRGRLGVRAPKAGCNPQGQCGCCTVLVDGAPRVSCVTPVRRIAGRVITTVDGLAEEDRERWSDALLATGGSQCGFCTPGIVCRLEGLRSKNTAADDLDAVDRALAAHLCRCTGWQTIREAWSMVVSGSSVVEHERREDRNFEDASRRATIEGGSPQQVSAEVALGRGGFSEDTAPLDSLVAVPNGEGGWVVAGSLTEARALAGKVQGRHGTTSPEPPLALPEGEWELTMRTGWVEPAYLETDASWCEPGGEPFTSLANGGAFGGKLTTDVGQVARELAYEHRQAIRVVLSREDVVRDGPKRPPIAAGVRTDGSGVIRVARTEGIAEAITNIAPQFMVEEVDVVGPPTSVDIRGAGVAEAQILLAALAAKKANESGDNNAHIATVTSAEGAVATVSIGLDGVVRVDLRCGRLLDAIVLRSYAIGAVHMALGWVTSEGLSVDEDGMISDLTIRSFGVLRSADMPHVEVTLHEEDTEPVNGSDAVFAATAAAVWSAQGWPTDWPTGRSVLSNARVTQ
ncbi:MAG: 2Fe-2S iron-sulfur cluster binding domain-containing protein [Acidimicrobiia bacterium]|nr:2Fe-2S iron-sulfur cluster binding domain-containing protein [Acidimicrobiia bacterium]